MAGESGERGSGLFASLKAGIRGVLAALRAFGRSLENGKPPASLPSPAPNQELPDSYKHPKVTLAVVDPYLVHAWWDIDTTRLPPDTISAALRFHDLSGAPSAVFDVDVDLRARNWYVHLWNPARSYYAELGIKTAGGEFRSLAASNKVRTPRAWPAAAAPVHTGQAFSPAVATPISNGEAPTEPRHALQPGRDVPEVTIQTNAPAPAGAPAEAPQPQPPRPVTAGNVLQQKLAQIYALRPWMSPQAATPDPIAPENRPFIPKQPLPSRAPVPVDLTALAEHQFHPGLPSSLPSAGNPESPTS